MGVKAGIVVVGGKLDGIVFWRVGLEDDLPAAGTSPCASGHLCKQLKGALGGLESRAD